MNQLKNEKENISIQDVIDRLRNEIVESYTPSCFNNFKRIWLLRITGTARKKDFELVKNIPYQ